MLEMMLPRLPDMSLIKDMGNKYQNGTPQKYKPMLLSKFRNSVTRTI